MFIRRIRRRKDGKDHIYWALVESYRTDRGVRQRVVGYLGDAGNRHRQGIQRAITPCDSFQRDFLSPEELPERVEILPRKTRTERKREFGGSWLGHRLFGLLGLDEVLCRLFPSGAEGVSWALVAKALVISRFCHPSSELHIAEHLYEQSAMEDLLGIPVSRMHANRLYRCLDRLLPHKDALQRHLKERLGTLFNVQYDLFLYDVTSTYFEGVLSGSALARRGYSRDSRGDCSQVCLALVVTREGLPLGYEVFAGNTSDSRTVETIVTKMESLYGVSDRIWVMDRGMISESNMAFLRANQRRYIVGTPKSGLRRFERALTDQADWQGVHDGVEVKLYPAPDGTSEVYILCRSRERAGKERGIHDRFRVRLSKGLEALHAACERSRGDITQAIERRIGRLLQQNSRAASLFDISVHFDAKSGKTALIVHEKDSPDHWTRRSEGHYLLRSNIKDWTPQQLWTAYIQLTDAEESFRIQKSDLQLRPVWHQKDGRIQGHILICFLAFVLWRAFGLMCKNAGLGDEPRKVFEEIRTIAMVDVVLTTTAGKELKIRTVAKPDKSLQFLLQQLGLPLTERLRKRVL